MFAKPRPKKSPLPPPSKKRKVHAIEEISFDNSAREEYLTGFHKRKVQRQKHAQEEAAKRAREEKIEMRKQVCLVPHRINAAMDWKLISGDFEYRSEKSANKKLKLTSKISSLC